MATFRVPMNPVSVQTVVAGGLQLSRTPSRRARQFAFSIAKALAAACGLLLPLAALAAGPGESPAFKALPPLVRGNLTIYPVIAAHTYDTSQLLTLDEGVRSGAVTVTEAGQERGLVRPGQYIAPPSGGAEVNRLVLYNNSERPLLLLAGEIVTGGKQDRVIGSDRIVPPQSGPIDLGVFCVEPHRWVASSSKFGSMSAHMAQPAVRAPAMAEHNQNSVWENVRSAQTRVAANLAGADALAVENTSSYAKVFASAPVANLVANYGGVDAESAFLRELRDRNASGVVVAVNGRILWADLFASTDLLAKYWPKLMRSYVAEAITGGSSNDASSQARAQSFLDALSGGREIVETEAGVFRRTDITGEGYRVFELASLMPKSLFTVHITKLAD